MNVGLENEAEVSLSNLPGGPAPQGPPVHRGDQRWAGVAWERRPAEEEGPCEARLR